jgi:hypothetical protein
MGLALSAGAALYLIPRTAVLGAIILTGYLDGAVATHVRVSDPVFMAPVVFGVLKFGVWLRDERLRTECGIGSTPASSFSGLVKPECCVSS